ncbi:MAG: hypothetical protein ACREB9_05525, partial [Thermoplasmata archaeon]
MAELTTGGLRWILAHRTAVEDATRGNAPRLGGLVVRHEEVEGRLVAAEFLLQSTDLLVRSVKLAFGVIEATELLEEGLPVGLGKGDIPVSVRVQSPVQEQRTHN